ncbi:MAG TPA: aldolase/citrate lyase family protein [Pseudomonadales bacterium]|nr:aldolase/citrate lyase family protein [Pseudomonadales bacterium]
MTGSHPWDWKAGAPLLGAWAMLPDVHVAESLARSGVDWICLDLQHGLMDYTDLVRLLPVVSAAPVTPIVRVAANAADQIGKALDAGAEGIIVPMVDTAEDARRAVEACRYPPAGRRSCGPVRPLLVDGPGYLGAANDRIVCFPMIETLEGLENVDAIAAVDGVSGLFVGPVDLCFGLGLAPGDFRNARFVDALATIRAACDRHGRAAGIFGYTPEAAAHALADGFRFASAGTDVGFLRDGLARGLAAARATADAPATSKTGY